MAKLKVYYNKEDDMNKYGEDQWLVMNPEMSGGALIIYKQVQVPFESELVQMLIKVYNSPEFQDATLIKGKAFYDNYFKNIHLDFVKLENGSFKLNTENDITKQVLCTWRVELDTTDKDRLFRIAPFDFSFPIPIYAGKLIDRAEEAKKVISEAMDKGLIGIKYLEETK